jgi:cell division septation protein DedD
MNKEVETPEINSAFTNEIPKVEEYDENTEEEINPFDELEDYIKDDSKDEAQELIDEEPSNSELVNEENIEHDNDGSSYKKTNLGEKPKKNYSSYSAMRNKNSEWYKNPVLFIALFSAIIAIVVIIIFWPSNNSEVNVADGENILFDEQENSTESDKSVTNDVGDETVSETDKAIEEKLAEIKRVENSTPVEPKVSNPKPSKSSELYREIKNDKTITSRIYFDGELYTVQSSSWKSTTIAEREVNKLRKRGFDAFIYKVYIPTKGSTWNRVRIGYFNSQKEAEEFLKKNKI